MTANPDSSLGKQVLSTKASTGTTGFGSSKRLVDFASDVPGPGERQKARGVAGKEAGTWLRRGCTQATLSRGTGRGAQTRQEMCGGSVSLSPSLQSRLLSPQERTMHEGGAELAWRWAELAGMLAVRWVHRAEVAEWAGFIQGRSGRHFSEAGI